MDKLRLPRILIRKKDEYWILSLEYKNKWRKSSTYIIDDAYARNEKRMYKGSVVAYVY